MKKSEWVVEEARNGELTLKLNNVYIYSKYQPITDSNRLIETINDENYYLLIGLGLGYHIQAILNKYPNSYVYVVAIDNEDQKIFNTYAKDAIKNHSNLSIITNITDLDISEDNIIIPVQWTKALKPEHPMKGILEDIKLRQMSKDKYGHMLDENFEYTSKLKSVSATNFNNFMHNKTACLVASGPSLNETISMLKSAKNRFFILAVNSSLKVLSQNGITPDAIIMSDGKPWMTMHFEGINLEVPLFYLATASKEVLATYKGEKIKLYQEGFHQSEQVAVVERQPLFKVGGSVATLGFSLLNYMGFSNIIMFGQDLGFRDGHTHAEGATSGIVVKHGLEYSKLEAYDGQQNSLFRSLMTYWRWFNKNAPLSNAQIFNTALKGTKINGVNYISKNEFETLLGQTENTNFEQMLRELI